MTEQCDIDRLERWFGGEVSATDAELCQAHVVRCESCRTQVDWWHRLRDSARLIAAHPAGTGEEDAWRRLRASLGVRGRFARHLHRPASTVATMAVAAAAVVLLVIGSRAVTGSREPLGGSVDVTSRTIDIAESKIAEEWSQFTASVRSAPRVTALLMADVHAAEVRERLREDAISVANLQRELAR